MPLASSPKEDTSQQLDESDVILLKKLANLFLSEKFQGSQLEALLAREAPVLSTSEAHVDVETPLVPSRADGTTSPTSQPSTPVPLSSLKAKSEAVPIGVNSSSRSRTHTLSSEDGHSSDENVPHGDFLINSFPYRPRE